MKEALLGLLQQRADKCTTEQFWAVATLSGMNAFVIAQKKDLLTALPAWAVILIITVPTIYGTYYVIHRHTSYYVYRAALAKLLQNEADAPAFLKKCPPTWKGKSLSGVVFYVMWIVGLWAVSFVTIVK